MTYDEQARKLATLGVEPDGWFLYIVHADGTIDKDSDIYGLKEAIESLKSVYAEEGVVEVYLVPAWNPSWHEDLLKE